MKKFLTTMTGAMVAAMFLLGLGATAASAASVPAVASTVSAHVVAASPQVAVPTGWADCRNSASRGGSPYMRVFYALADWRCSGTVIGVVSTASADHICWGSRQWWGAPYRWVVWMINSGQYSVC